MIKLYPPRPFHKRWGFLLCRINNEYRIMNCNVKSPPDPLEKIYRASRRAGKI